MNGLPSPWPRRAGRLIATLTCVLLALTNAAPRAIAAAGTPVLRHGPNQYTIVATTGAFTPLPETARINDGPDDDDTYAITLPFPYRFYRTLYPAGARLWVSTNGNIQFGSHDITYEVGPLPYAGFSGGAILGLQADLVTAVYVAVSGTAPHRILTIEERGVYYQASERKVDFQIRLFEDGLTRYFDVTYGTLDQRDNPGAVGVQEGAGASYTQYGNAGSWDVRAGMRLIFYASTDVSPPGLRPIDATIQTTDVGRIPTALAVDSTRGHAFVASGVAGTITMLDAHTGALLRTVRVGRDPSALAVAARTGRLFVADPLDDRVSVLDATSGTLLRSTGVGRAPAAIAVDEATGRVFVANRDDGSVSVLDAADGSLLTTTPVGAFPRALAVDEATGRVFVADGRDAAITILDAASGRNQSTLHLPGRVAAMAVDGDSGNVVVAANTASERGMVLVLDGRTGATLRSTPVGSAVTAVAIAVRAGRIVAAGTDGQIRLLDSRTGALRSVTDVTGGDGYAALRLAVDEAKGHILVAAPGPVNVERLFTAAGTLSVLDARDGSVVGTAILGHSPVALAIDARGDRALVLDNADNTLSVLDDARL